MSMSIKERFNRYMAAYEQGDYSLVRREWRMLSSEERLEIYYLVYKNKKMEFFDFEQFHVHSSDVRLIQDAKIKYSRELGLTTEQQMEIYFGLKIDGKASDYEQQIILRNIAAYARFREYAEMFREDTSLAEFSKLNYNIIKYDPESTKARIYLLRSLGGSESLSIEDFVQEIMLSKEEFGYFYEEAMMDKLYEWQEKDVNVYNALMKDKIEPMHMNYRELEESVSLFYGDLEYAKRIEGQKREVKSKSYQDTQLDGIEMIDLFGEPVMVKEEGSRNVENSGSGNSSIIQGNHNKIEKLNIQKIKQFIKDATEAGFEHLGYITTESGTKGKGEDEVFFYIFEKNKKRYMIPIGQVGNAMYLITDDNLSLEQLRPLVKIQSRDELVKNGILKRKYNKRTPEKAYDYDVALQLLINWGMLNNEGMAEKKKVINRAKKARSISDIKREVVESVPKEETRAAAEYMARLKPITFEGYTFFVEESAIQAERNGSLKFGRPPREENEKRRSKYSRKNAEETVEQAENNANAVSTDFIDTQKDSKSGGDHDEF